MTREKPKDTTPVKVAGRWVPLGELPDGTLVEAISWPTTASAIAALNAVRVGR